MFQLTSEESKGLRFQIGTSKKAGRGGRRYNPYVFTEQGVAMLSSVLNTERAVQVNVAIMRAFVQLRELAASNCAIANKLDELEQRYDAQFKVVFEAIREMMEFPTKKVRKNWIHQVGQPEKRTGQGAFPAIIDPFHMSPHYFSYYCNSIHSVLCD
jgi:hypothetical protein